MLYLFPKSLSRQLLLNSFQKGSWHTTNRRPYRTSYNLNKEKQRNVTDNLTKQSVATMSETLSSFKGLPDRYKGLTIDSTQETCDSTVFPAKLEESLRNWSKSDVRGVWFKIGLGQAEWVPILARNGFGFHHAKAEYVMMYRWLPTEEESNAPRFAHTMIGVGAVVVNDSGEVLVVREKYFPKGYPHWKLPGGYVEQAEDIQDAAIREVLEETNVTTEFQFLISFRHTHGANFGCSDIYFVVALTPTTRDIKKCNREIQEAQWMKIDEYLQHPYVHETNKSFLQKYLEYKDSGVIVGAVKGTHPLLKRPYTVFTIEGVDKCKI